MKSLCDCSAVQFPDRRHQHMLQQSISGAGRSQQTDRQRAEQLSVYGCCYPTLQQHRSHSENLTPFTNLHAVRARAHTTDTHTQPIN